MILPVPKSFKLLDAMEDFPWTVTIVFLNLLLYFLLFSHDPVKTSKAEDKEILSTEFIQSAGHFYLEWQNTSQLGHADLEFYTLGSQAVRDIEFITSLNKWKSDVDPVGFEKWRDEFNLIFKKQKNDPINIFGLSQIKSEPMTWLTYQFSHHGGLHIFINLLYLVFFAAVVEKMVGGLMMGVIYIIGGFMGGYFFMLMDSSGLIPLVGASASVTALMGFVAAGSLKKNIEYYFLPALLVPGFCGRFYLSPLWIIPICLIDDLTEVLSNPPGFSGGVAYSAHIGGAFAGLVLGMAFKYGALKARTENRNLENPAN